MGAFGDGTGLCYSVDLTLQDEADKRMLWGLYSFHFCNVCLFKVAVVGWALNFPPSKHAPLPLGGNKPYASARVQVASIARTLNVAV